MSAPLLFACVAENRPRYATMVQTLALSVRQFAGAHRDAPIIALFVDAVDPAYRDALAALDVDVRVVARVPGGNPLANKLRMFELADSDRFEVLAALDCDTVVLGDPGPWADPDRIGAKAADYDRFTAQEWSGVFEALGLALPPRTLVATATGDPLPPYFNSGVVLAPHRHCAPLGAAWTEAYTRLRELIAREPTLIREQWRWLAEQLALGCGILTAQLPWHELPPALNFPTHIPVAPALIPSAPVIAHYHGDHDADGFLYRSRSPQLDGPLDAVNRRRAQLTGVPYGGIGRAPLADRLRRAVASWFWAQLADRAWYRSARVTALRAQLRRWRRRGS